MKYLVTPSAVTVVIDGKSYSQPRPCELFEQAARAGNVVLIHTLLGIDPLLDQIRSFGGHLDESSRYFVKNAKGRYWKAPFKGTTGEMGEAHPYLPSEIRAVIGPHDQVELVHA